MLSRSGKQGLGRQSQGFDRGNTAMLTNSLTELPEAVVKFHPKIFLRGYIVMLPVHHEENIQHLANGVQRTNLLS